MGPFNEGGMDVDIGVQSDHPSSARSLTPFSDAGARLFGMEMNLDEEASAGSTPTPAAISKGKMREERWIMPGGNRYQLVSIEYHIPDRYLRVRCQKCLHKRGWDEGDARDDHCLVKLLACYCPGGKNRCKRRFVFSNY